MLVINSHVLPHLKCTDGSYYRRGQAPHVQLLLRILWTPQRNLSTIQGVGKRGLLLPGRLYVLCVCKYSEATRTFSSTAKIRFGADDTTHPQQTRDEGWEGAPIRFGKRIHTPMLWCHVNCCLSIWIDEALHPVGRQLSPAFKCKQVASNCTSHLHLLKYVFCVAEWARIFVLGEHE